jgi:hypothetical protein
MTITFRPAKRLNTPLIIGLAGPTKSGKTYSAHRLAAGLANGGQVAMINAEGAKGHQYSDKFSYVATDLQAPFRPERYTEALQVALALDPKPAVVIIDSLSHMHNGPGGVLEYQAEELDRLAGKDASKEDRDRYNPSAWIKPKAAENRFIYEALSSPSHLIFCLRAKEKMKWVKGGAPIALGWQPIVGEQVAFETIFTLTLPPHCKGVPDLNVSEMREPFDSMIPAGRQLDEETGGLLAAWAAGGASTNGADKAQLDKEEALLRKTLLDIADKMEKRDVTEQAIASHQGERQERRIAWLKTQLERAQAVVA